MRANASLSAADGRSPVRPAFRNAVVTQGEGPCFELLMCSTIELPGYLDSYLSALRPRLKHREQHPFSQVRYMLPRKSKTCRPGRRPAGAERRLARAIAIVTVVDALRDTFFGEARVTCG